MLSAAVSCSYSVEDAPFFNEESAPAMPCLISGDTTLLIVRDYFPRIEKVDAVSSEDYTIVPVSREDMDTVLVIAGPDSRSVSAVKVTSGDGCGVIVLAVPSIATVGSNMGGREFTVRAENSPAGYLVLWQNTLLDHNFMSYRKNGEFTVHIPDNAEDMERSYIRIYTYNAEGAGSDILVPVRYGRVLDHVSDNGGPLRQRQYRQ